MIIFSFHRECKHGISNEWNAHYCKSQCPHVTSALVLLVVSNCNRLNFTMIGKIVIADHELDFEKQYFVN